MFANILRALFTNNVSEHVNAPVLTRLPSKSISFPQETRYVNEWFVENRMVCQNVFTLRIGKTRETF